MGGTTMKKLLGPIVLFTLALTFLSIPFDAEAGNAGRLYREQMEVGRALIEVQSTNLPSIIPYYTDDIEYHDPIVDIYGIETMTAFLFQLFGSSPDLVTTVHDETLVDGVYSATWTMVGQFAGVPYDAKGISLIKFRPKTAQVYYQRDYYTEGDIMANIPGLDEAIWSFRAFYRCGVDPTYDCPLELPPSEAPAVLATKPGDEAADKGNNRIRSRRWLREAQLETGRLLVQLDAVNWPTVIPSLTDDYEYHDPIVDIYGPSIMAEFLARLFANSSELYTVIEEETLIDDIYTATWTMAGAFNGVPFSAPGMSIVKFRDRSADVYYSRDYYTEGDIMAAVPGLDEAVLGFRTFYRCAVDPTYDCPLELPPAGMDKSKAPQAKATFGLGQNAPNPFNPSTEISFVVPEGGANVSLRIYDITGRLVRTLVDGFEPGGSRAVSWHGRTDQGQPAASGVYYYQMTGPAFSDMKKMVLLK